MVNINHCRVQKLKREVQTSVLRSPTTELRRQNSEREREKEVQKAEVELPSDGGPINLTLADLFTGKVL